MIHPREIINDPIFVKRLERRIGRKLTNIESEEGQLVLYHSHGSIVRVLSWADDDMSFRGYREYIEIPKIVFPDDLMSRPELDLHLDQETEIASLPNNRRFIDFID